MGKRLVLISMLLLPGVGHAFNCVSGDALTISEDTIGASTKGVFREVIQGETQQKLTEMEAFHLIYRLPAGTGVCRIAGRPDKTTDPQSNGHLVVVPGVPLPLWVDERVLHQQ